MNFKTTALCIALVPALAMLGACNKHNDNDGDDMTPAATAPADTMPADNMADETMPADSMSADDMAGDSMSGDGMSFAEMDKNGDGGISKDELAPGMLSADETDDE